MASPLVNLTINGQPVQVEAGSTVLKAASAAGIDIPTLCDHPAVAPIGSCRMCLVEIERQPSLETACTYQVSEGMVVHTESAKCVDARKFMLHMLFSERNHYCMYCQMSGDCELQDLAYQHGIVDWPYPRPTDPLPLDASREFFSLDHNRCILCQRCVRACSELVANHTLGVQQRGIASMITADTGVPMGESSCIQCGTCLQICPTGALIDRKTAYRGREEQVDLTKSTCVGCSVGCGIEVITRDNNLIRVDGDWDAVVNQGLLCRVGRFDPVYDTRHRVTSPQVRRNGKLEAASWEEAISSAADGLREAEVAAFVSPRATNETLSEFSRLFRAHGAKTVASVGSLAPTLGRPGSFSDLEETDFIIVVGTDLTADHQVAGMFVRRAVDRGARLALVADGANGLADWASWHTGFDSLDTIVEVAQRANRPVVLYSGGLPTDVIAALGPLSGEASFIGLSDGANARGAANAAMRVSDGSEAATATALFVLAEDDTVDLPHNRAEFVVLQTSYDGPLMEVANVVLPAPIWAEQSGSLTNAEGKVQSVQAAMEPPPGVWSSIATLQALAQQLNA